MATKVLTERYRLDEPLGRGGMGTVWRAHDLLLDRDVAVKEVVFPAGTGERDERVLRQRTLREARTAARVSHPGVVQVHDVVEADGRPWIVLELVRGARTLADELVQAGPLEPARAAAVGLDVLDGLAAAHEVGVVHRDLKPSNVLVDGSGRARLTDFGLARGSADPGITTSGVLVGSPPYMAPERVRDSDVGPAADLWSLGATLFHAVEGRPPFAGRDPVTTLYSVVYDEPARPERAGPLTALLGRLLDKDARRRPGVSEVRAVLAAVAATARADGALGSRPRPPGDGGVPAARDGSGPLRAKVAQRARAGERATAAAAVPVAALSSMLAGASRRAGRAAGRMNAHRWSARPAWSVPHGHPGSADGEPDEPADAAQRTFRFRKRWIAIPLATVLAVALLALGLAALVVTLVVHTVLG